MANTVMAGALLTPGIRAEFVEVWSPIYDGLKKQFSDILWLDATSDKLTEIYAFLESTPMPERWDRGTVIPSKNFKSKQFSVTNRDWGFRIYHHSNDEGDDQTGSLMAKVRELAQNWVILDEEIIYQYIQDAANPRLLPAVPLSADGIDLYTSSTRYGSSDGNQVAESGTANEQQIITDILSVHRRYNEFQNTEGQPLFNVSQTMSMKVLYAPSLALVMASALTKMATFSWQEVTGAAGVATAAATDNVLKTAGFSIEPIMSQRVTDTSRYFFLRGLPTSKRPIFKQVREGLSEALGTWEVSDHTRDTGEKYTQFKDRGGWGSCQAFATIKLT